MDLTNRNLPRSLISNHRYSDHNFEHLRWSSLEEGLAKNVDGSGVHSLDQSTITCIIRNTHRKVKTILGRKTGDVLINMTECYVIHEGLKLEPPVASSLSDQSFRKTAGQLMIN